MKWKLNCREASLRLVRQELEAQAWWARLPVQLHLLACQSCQGFARQMRLLTQASAAWRRYSEHDDAR